MEIGVSNGYFKREDLTNEKFINSPFNLDEKIYNTGDLAYYNQDGNISLLGRSDFQVKLRGYRIELGEIENAILKFDGIKQTVVTIIDNKFLACYYVSDKEINSSEIISLLINMLPNYMIPTYYKKIESIPLTPNGKVDRKKLPEIELTTPNTNSKLYTNTEKILIEAASKILKIDGNNIDVDIPFFALGFDSLGLIHLQGALIYHGFNLTTQDFYKYSSIKILAEHIDSNLNLANETTALIPDKCKHLDEQYYDASLLNEDSLGNVLITGANGFIGIHILHELLKITNSNIYCLVRGASKEHSIERLATKYNFYFKENIYNLINNRIFIVNGDITYPNLNLDKSNIDSIMQNINTIIHTAAIVKHYGNFSEFEEININGTKYIANLALDYDKRLIHLSSLSVSGNYLVKQDNKNKDFTENDLYIGQHYTQNVYVNSKLSAENLVYSLIEKGLTAKVLRIGIIAGRYSDGVFQENIYDNAFYNRIKSMILLGKVSSNMLMQHVEFTPIDYCAKAICLLAKTNVGDNKVFHLYNHNLSKISQITNLLNSYNINIGVLDNKSFEDHLLKISEFDPNNSALRGIVNDLTISQDNSIDVNYDFSVNIKSDYTVKFLKLLGFEWPICDDIYVKKLLTYMRDVNFI